MGQRRNRTVDLEMESQPSSQPEPSSIPLGSAPQQPDDDDDDDIPASPYFPNLESLSLEEPAYDNSAVFYGLPQYHHHPHHHDPTNFYVPYVTFLPPPIQLPSPTNFHLSDHEYERNAHFMDHTRGAYYKRKSTEGIPLTTLAAPYAPYAPNSFIQGNYAGHHPFPPPGSILYDPSFWPHTHYMHGGNIGNPTAFMYPSHLNPRDHYHHHHHHHPAPLPIQGVRGQSATLYPHMASSVSYRVPFGSFAPQNAMNSGPSNSEMNPVQPTEFRLYEHDQGDDSVHVATLREHRGGVPRLTLMPDDEVAMLEFGDFGSGNSLIDQHRDMRLDIEGMSYEEISALTERIGTVNTGLPEEDVKNHLKTRTYSGMNHEEEESSSLKTKETESCTICQESFKNEEKIGTLDCGHEYHAECLEKWLIVKNICPICKSEALVMEKKKD